MLIRPIQAKTPQIKASCRNSFKVRNNKCNYNVKAMAQMIMKKYCMGCASIFQNCWYLSYQEICNSKEKSSFCYALMISTLFRKRQVAQIRLMMIKMIQLLNSDKPTDLHLARINWIAISRETISPHQIQRICSRLFLILASKFKMSSS